MIFNIVLIIWPIIASIIVLVILSFIFGNESYMENVTRDKCEIDWIKKRLIMLECSHDEWEYDTCNYNNSAFAIKYFRKCKRCGFKETLIKNKWNELQAEELESKAKKLRKDIPSSLKKKVK